MRAVELTTKRFLRSVKALALPGLHIEISRSHTHFGHSNYVFMHFNGSRSIKIRISDHAIGMRRAKSEAWEQEVVYIRAGDKPETWAAWLDDLRRRKGVDQLPAGPLFEQQNGAINAKRN